jgi:large subunit ribosomal protein L23
MFETIKNPIFTEKTMRMLEEYNQYVFDVDLKLKKSQVCSLVEKIFLVRIASVNLYKKCRKTKSRVGSFRKKSKRAIVTVFKAEKIKFFPKV